MDIKIRKIETIMMTFLSLSFSLFILYHVHNFRYQYQAVFTINKAPMPSTKLTMKMNLSLFGNEGTEIR